MKPTKSDMATSKYPGTEVEKIFGQHGAYLKKLADEGVVIFAGYTAGTNPGELSIAVLNSESIQIVLTIMNSAPAVSAKLLTAEVVEFEVFISHDRETK